MDISKTLDFEIISISTKNSEIVYESTDWVIGCAMLFNIEKMHKVGFFDKNIFLYGEENELCYRTIKSGGKIYYINNIEYKHLGTKSSPSTNNYIFLRKFHQTIVVST